jgi:hypothetical protein
MKSARRRSEPPGVSRTWRSALMSRGSLSSAAYARCWPGTRLLFGIVLLCLAAGCRHGISGPYPDFTYRTVAVENVSRSILYSFKTQHPEMRIKSVETASFGGDILQYRFRFTSGQGQVELALFDSEGRLVAPPGLFRPDSESTDSRNVQGTGETGHVTAP